MLKHRYSFEAFGTKWQIDADKEISQALKRTIQDRIESFDSLYSRFRNDSLVSRIAKTPGSYSFPGDAIKLFDFYKKIYTLTDGKVTPLIGDVLSRAGYDAQYSFQSKPQKPLRSWEEVMEWNGSNVITKLPAMLDIGAAGKGYMVDIIASVLDENNIDEYVIDASGDLRHKGTSENKVGLEHPLDPTKIIGVVDVQNKSLCASASNRRVWGEGMHHIFDPVALLPVKDIIATWVIADETMVADGIATALFFTDPKILRKSYDFEYARIHSNGVIEYSSFFKSNLF